MKKSCREVLKRHQSNAAHTNSGRLTRQLAAYSVAAGAGVFVADQAGAVVVPIELPGGGPVVLSESLYSLDVDGDGQFDFSLESYFGSLSIYDVTGNYLNSIVQQYGGALLLLGGEFIDEYLGSYSAFADLDSFVGTRGYAGILFDIPGSTPHYGYLDLEVSSDSNTLTLHGGAFESQPNTGIEAGAIPEPNSLSLLAMGAVGTAAWRRRRSDSES